MKLIPVDREKDVYKNAEGEYVNGKGEKVDYNPSTPVLEIKTQ